MTDEAVISKTLEKDIFDAKFTRSTETDKIIKMPEQRQLEPNFNPCGQRFLDYLGYQAGLLELSDIINLGDLTL